MNAKPPKKPPQKGPCPKGNGHQWKFPADTDDDGSIIHLCRKCKTTTKMPKGNGNGKKS